MKIQMKNIYLNIFFIILTVSILGCSSSKLVSSQEIRDELHTIYPADVEITEIVIEKRDTNTKNKRDYIWCIVTSQDNVIEYTKHYLVEAYLYSEGGWIIDDIKETNLSLWRSRPISGVESSIIKEELINKRIIIQNEEWKLRSGTIKNLKILQHDTDLEREKDKVLVDLELNSELMQAQGSVELLFEFKSGWELVKFDVIKDFTSDYKEGYNLTYSEEDIVSAIVQKNMQLGDDISKQYVSINANEIEYLSIDQESIYGKGTKQIIDFSFNLDKSSVLFNVDGSLGYQFQNNNWSINTIDLDPTIINVDLVGQWVGKYYANQGETKLVLNIIKVADDGEISAIFNFSETPTNPGVPSGSYKMVGGIDLQDLTIYLKGTEWIEQPSRYTFVNLQGLLFVDENYIRSTGGTEFEVTMK